MKLLNCYIYNFGKYHEYKVDLNNDLHEIFLNNGEGKTTLVSFIVAVFFGGEVENIKELLNKYQSIDYPNDRYGGEINFEYNGEEYNLIHTFSKKQNKDKFKSEILKLSKKGSSFTETRFDDDSPITYFFKDIEKPATAILNTVILSHETFTKNKGDESLDDLFSSQLGELYDLKEFDDVIKAIDEKIKEYSSSRAKNTAYAKATALENDILDQKKEKEKEIEVKKDELKKLYGADNLRQIGGYVDKIDKQIEEIEKEIEQFKEDSSKIDLYQEYNQLETSLKKAEEEIALLNNEINNQPLTDEVLSKLDALNEEIKKDDAIVTAKTTELNVINVDEEYLKISNEEANKIKKVYEEYQSSYIEENRDEVAPRQTSKKSLINIFMFLTALFLIVAVCGLVLMSFFNEYSTYLYIVIGVGGAGSIGSLIGLFISYNSKNKLEQTNINSVLNNNENIEILEKKRTLEDFFMKLRLSTTDLKYSYETFSKKHDSNISSNQRKEALHEELNSLKDALKKKNSAFINELSKFGYDSIDSIDTFLIHLKVINKSLKENNAELTKVNKELKDPKFKGFDKLDKNKLNYQSNQDSIDELNEKKTNLVNNRKEVLYKLNEYNKVIEEKKILEDRYYENRNEVWYYMDLAERYKKGKEFLIQAKESIYATTYEPFLKELNKILDEEKTNEKFFNSYEIKTDKKTTQIVFKNKGIEKTSASLSQGYQDYLKIAVRFSFLNMIYKNEKPFIILDDPLVNMDKDRLKNIKTIIKELSKSYQIIYFYCHESRKIK